MISVDSIKALFVGRNGFLLLRKLMTFILVLAFGISLSAQSKVPKNYFRSPLKIPLYLSGSFGELRSGHFHSGIDIKTGGVQGKKVYAVAGGYVSRINISLGGYGKALYITHPGGFVSVYGHLSRFNDTLQALVKETQYKRERYLVEIFPKKNRFVIKKGEMIAYTGNSGSSLGPHLHFEIREEKTQYPLNPLLFKSIHVADHQPPRIVRLAIYPVDDTSLINGKNDTLVLSVYGADSKCHLKENQMLNLHGRVSFGISSYDKMDKVPNKNGIYNLQVMVDSFPFFGLKMNKLSFSTTRYINSLIDYNYYRHYDVRFIRTEVDSNNRLFNYYKVKNAGIVSFNDDTTHRISMTIKDISGNKAVLSFFVKGNSHPLSDSIKKVLIKSHKGEYFSYKVPHFIQGKHFTANFPANDFYRSFYFTYKENEPLDSSLSYVVVLDNRFTPVHKLFTLSILPDSVPVGEKDKMYIAKIGEGDDVSGHYTGGVWKKNYLTTTVRTFGKYTILVDTIPPIITPLHFPKGKMTTTQKTLQFNITDSQTGVKSYNATINGKWLLFEYDQKNDLLTYFIDDHLPKGKSNFQLKVTDRVGNVSIFKTVINR